MDNLVLIRVASDLDGDLRDAHLVEIRQETTHRHRLRFERDDRALSVVVSLQPELPWIGRPAMRWEGPRKSPSEFTASASKRLRGCALRSVHKPGSDRTIRLTFGDGHALVAELATHGANLILLDPDGKTVVAARHPKSARSRIEPGASYQAPDLPRAQLDPGDKDPARIDRFLEDRVRDGESPFEALRRHVFGIGTAGARLILDEARATGASPGEITRTRLDLLADGRLDPVIEAPDDPVEALRRGRFTDDVYTLWPWSPRVDDERGTRLFQRHGPATTAGLYHEGRERSIWVRQRVDGLAVSLRREARRMAGLERRVERDLARFAEPDRHRLDGEAILAGLAIARRVGDHVHVPDPYDPDRSWREIPVPAGRTLPEAADESFRRHRRAVRGAEAARGRLESIRQRGEAIDRLREQARTCEGPDALRSLESDMRAHGLAVGLVPTRRTSPALSAHARSRLEGVRLFIGSRDTEILAGKSGRDNQRLTFRLAGPEDFWFHALGRPGAHVIARNPDRRKRPDPETVEEAAAIAAWYSDGRGEDRVDVQWTRRKYVRKIRGAPPGTVTVKRFETIRVRPGLPAGQEEGPGAA